ncbi:hypothetical protein POSPLADRAFT_1131632 [Postia placenta MAD-698-R-SB12]|uniref:DUF6535 domain-containing protein n=1 Tax=Postia placenta MAD-698-R-SB12 TaxID=670580 RepID=A0A1X6ND37_9APHY|nr:hypothetical protein POSPLADRAFT_1131632 [Postia placenta MAD-698-R-SB12]OSX66531.1 hypothetical protein POSPLADRAFT_1131632 [Postia placenta MAD-698-R-SB12]
MRYVFVSPPDDTLFTPSAKDQCPRRNSRPTCPDLTSDPCLIRQDENNPIHDDSIVASQQTVPAESLHAITQVNVPSVILKQSTPDVVDASDAWEECAREVWDREEALVKKWKDEINTLLTFAGLFSAALTAFNVQYYLALQPQSPDPTTQAVLILVGAVAASGGSTDIIQPLLAQLNASSTTTPISSHVVSINALWFSALVFSLSAASLAISVNQWLHHHIDHAASKSRQSVRVWYFRHQGFTSWHVPFIISLLPVLLQTSLALFLIGLVELLWTLNPIVAGIVTALILVLLSVSILSTFFPAVSPSCPYKSQPAWWSVLVIQHILDLILPIVERFASLTTWTWQNAISDWCGAQRARPRLISWQEFDDTAVRSQVENASANDTLLMLVEADATVRDDDFLRTVVRPCLQWGDLPACLPAFYRILEHRAHEVLASTDPPTLKWSRSEQDGQALIAMGHISVDIIERIAASPTSHDAGHTKHLMRILGLLLNLLHAIPQTNSTVFSRLVRLGPTIDVSDDVHDRLAQLFQLAGDRYAINTDGSHIFISAEPQLLIRNIR